MIETFYLKYKGHHSNRWHLSAIDYKPDNVYDMTLAGKLTANGILMTVYKTEAWQSVSTTVEPGLLRYDHFSDFEKDWEITDKQKAMIQIQLMT